MAAERPVTTADFRTADEVLLSNAIVEVLPVKEIAYLFTGRSSFEHAVALRAAYRDALFKRESRLTGKKLVSLCCQENRCRLTGVRKAARERTSSSSAKQFNQAFFARGWRIGKAAGLEGR